MRLHAPLRRRCGLRWIYAAVAAAALLGIVPTAGAATTVSGDLDTNAPLVIDPTGSPVDPFTSTIDLAGTRTVAFVSRMPVTKAVSQIAVGDLASATSCTTTPASVRLYVREHLTGELASSSQIAYSAAYQNLPSTPGRVTWAIPPTIFREGRGYSVTLGWDPAKCRYGQITTWAHNEATVDGGGAACTLGAPAQPSGDQIEKRMWHSSGISDRQSACVSNSASWAFDPSMPEGWLLTSGSWVYTATAWLTPPSATAACGATAAAGGAEVVYWRPNPTYPGTHSDYVCMWPQYEPLNQTVDDGWYHGIPWKNDGNGGPRDVYLELDTIDYEQLLEDNVPEFRYDDDERFFPMAASSITDFYVDDDTVESSNALKGAEEDPEEFALANPGLIPPLGVFPADALTLGYLGSSYPSGGSGARAGTPALSSDFLSERGSDANTAAADAATMQGDPTGQYFGKIYGHVAADSQGRTWLQYFRFYYYNDQAVLGIGSHEGDWESVQVRLDSSLEPDLVSYEAHGGEETCDWDDAQTNNGRAIAWVGAASHAAYSDPGTYRLGLDEAQGDGYWLLYPSIEMVTSDTPWMQWPGRWGDSGGNSPLSPLHQGSKWDDPDAWIGNVDDCDMGDPP